MCDRGGEIQRGGIEHLAENTYSIMGNKIALQSCLAALKLSSKYIQEAGKKKVGRADLMLAFFFF